MGKKFDIDIIKRVDLYFNSKIYNGNDNNK